MNNIVEPRLRRPILRLSALSKTFRQGERELHILDGASAELYEGEAVALVAPSGSGKTTLLQVAGLLDRPDSGSVILAGKDCANMGDRERTRIRRTEIGFVYQFHHLLPEFTAEENVAMPLLIRRMERGAALARARAVLGELGLAKRQEHLPSELSGGERQRCAFARAMVTAPVCVLADEPTGNLDSQTADEVFEAMVRLSDSRGTAFVLVTHDAALAARAGRVLELRAGKLGT